MPDLVGVLAKESQVVAEVIEPVQAHAPFHAAGEHLLAVRTEIQFGASLQQFQHLVQISWGISSFRAGLAAVDVGMLEVLDQCLGHLLDGQNVVGQASGNGALRHLLVLGRCGVLDHGHAPRGLDGFQAQGTGRSGPGKDDANSPFLLILGQGTEEAVHGRLRGMPLYWPGQTENPSVDGHEMVRWDDVDVIGLDRHVILDLNDGHGGVSGQQPDHEALVRRIEMRHQHKGDPAFGWHRSQELLERIQPAGRGSDADNGWSQPFRLA